MLESINRTVSDLCFVAEARKAQKAQRQAALTYQLDTLVTDLLGLANLLELEGEIDEANEAAKQSLRWRQYAEKRMDLTCE